MLKTAKGLMYFISETHYFDQCHSILILGLIGSLTERNATQFEGCLNAVGRATGKMIILNFRDLAPEIDPTTVKMVARLQEAVRRKRVALCFSSVHPALRKLLENTGVVHPELFSNNLAEALESLSPEKLPLESRRPGG